MVFSSILFLFFFLPLTLLLYYLSPRSLRNAILLLVSLVFYAWGEAFYVLLMLISISINYLAGLGIAHFRYRGWLLGFAVAANLCLLFYFKYANFICNNLNAGLGLGLNLETVHLPIGISFFTFQAISYLIDVYRGEAPAQQKPIDLALYIALFPQLIAGPIVRYHDVAAQIASRFVDAALFASGTRRFIVGLAKKVLLANVLGAAADQIFSSDYNQLGLSTAWLGLLCYSLQIYFDFSGYSDMAIGLGRMFGFRFLENFNYPYIAASVQGFWRRWHISLSTWFRDYLYIPLGGSRVKPWRIYLNLVLVFFLCGLWHGASWNFVVWGLLHGLFLVAERLGLGGILSRLWKPLAHLYTLTVVCCAWVFFRVEALPDALTYFAAMFDPGHCEEPTLFYVTNELRVVLVFALLGVTPILKRFWEFESNTQTGLDLIIRLARVLALFALLILCASYLASGTYNPFIYFRF